MDKGFHNNHFRGFFVPSEASEPGRLQKKEKQNGWTAGLISYISP